MDYPCTDVRAFNESLPFQDGTFDAVFTLAVLEHVRDPFAAGREIMRVLKPGGMLYSMVPLMVPFHGYPNHFYNMTVEGHKNLYGTALDLLDASVPVSGRPIWGLHCLLTNWLNGLPAAHREEFLDLRVRDVLATSPLEQLKRNYEASRKKLGGYEFYNLVEKCLIEVPLTEPESKRSKELDLERILIKEIKLLANCLSRFKPADWNKFLDVVIK